MRIEITINGEPFYNEDIGELEVDESLPFDERFKRKEAAVKLYLLQYAYKIDMVKAWKGHCEVYVVFESKMNKNKY